MVDFLRVVTSAEVVEQLQGNTLEIFSGSSTRCGWVISKENSAANATKSPQEFRTVNVTVHGDEDQVIPNSHSKSKIFPNWLLLIFISHPHFRFLILHFCFYSPIPTQELLSPTESDNEDLLPNLSSSAPIGEVTIQGISNNADFKVLLIEDDLKYLSSLKTSLIWNICL